MAVGLLLLPDHGDVGVAALRQRPQHRPEARAVQRGIDDGGGLIHVLAAQQRLLLDLLGEGGVHVLADV